MDKLVPYWLAYVVLSVALALVLPEKVLSNSPWLMPLIHQITLVVPSIKPYAEISRFPEVALLNFSVHWLVFPFLIFGFWRHMKYRPAVGAALVAEKGRLVFVLGPFLLLYLVWFVATYAPTPEELRGRDAGLQGLVAGLAGESRLGLGIVSGVFYFCLAIIAAAGLKLVTLIPENWRAGREAIESRKGTRNG